MTKPNFRPIAPLDVDDHALDQVNDRLGVPQMVRPTSPKSQHTVTTVKLVGRDGRRRGVWRGGHGLFSIMGFVRVSEARLA